MAKSSSKSRAAAVPAPGPTYAHFADFGRNAVAAAIDSNAALSAGFEAMGREVALCTRAALENAGETARGLLGARTLEDVVRLQTEFARRSLDRLVEGTAKLSELSYSAFGASIDAWTARAKTSAP